MSGSIYVSPSATRSLWQEYRVLPDRIELQCKVALHTLVIPVDEIVDIQIRPPLVFTDLFRGKRFAYAFPLKIDWADVSRHVAIEKKSGLMKHIRFTPENPDKFVEACKTTMKVD